MSETLNSLTTATDDPWAESDTVLALRTCKRDGTSHNGFCYDLTPGAVTVAPDWNPKPVCSGGLHVLPEAGGSWSLLDWNSDAVAMIVRVRRDEIVWIDVAKAKVPRLRVERITTVVDALCELACDGEINHSAAKDYSQIATSGNGSRIATSGYGSQIAASGDYSQIATSSNDSQIATSSYRSRITALGNDSRITALGNGSRIAALGYDSRITALGRSSLVFGAYSCTAIAGEYGCIALAWWDRKARRRRVSVGYVGEELRAGVAYTLDEQGRFVEVVS